MKPRLGFGRRQDTIDTAQPEHPRATSRCSQATSPRIARRRSNRRARQTRRRSAPISALPPRDPNPPVSRGPAWGWSSASLISAIVFVLAIYATGSPTTNPLPLAQTTNALFWTVAVVAAVAAGAGALVC